MERLARTPVTPKGYEELQDELRKFKDEKPVVIKAIGEARDQGDLSENAEYHAARERLALIEANITKLEDIISRAQIIDPTTLSGSKVQFGATVTVYDEGRDEEITYQLLGEPEADISKNKISVMAPLGKALLGKEEGDDVKFQTPKGTRELSIVSVEYL